MATTTYVKSNTDRIAEMQDKRASAMIKLSEVTSLGSVLIAELVGSTSYEVRRDHLNEIEVTRQLIVDSAEALAIIMRPRHREP